MIFSRLRRAKILHCIREYLSDNFHFSGNYHSKPRTDTPFKLFHSPAFAPPAELKQASKMLGWEIPSPLEENPTHTYGLKWGHRLRSQVLEQMEFQARSQIVLPMSSRNDIKREWRGVYSAWYTAVLHKRCPTHRSSRWLSLSYVMSLLRFREVYRIWKGRERDFVTSAL